jgi:Zn-dependent protease
MFNLNKVEVGTLFGIPIVLDPTLIVLILVSGWHYITSGNVNDIAYGLVLATGLILSILAHEFGHAAAGRYYGVRTSHIELNGLGGLNYYADPWPQSRFARIIMLLAGPAVTALLWFTFDGLYQYVLSDLPDAVGAIGGIDRVSQLFWQLGFINSWLLVFNLLPSHPLDGGRALAELLSGWIGYDNAMRLIAGTGFFVVAWLVYLAIGGSFFAGIIALDLAMTNLNIWQTHTGRRWDRWN